MAGLGGGGDLDQASALDVVHEAVDGDGAFDEWVVADARDVVDDALLPVGDGEPVDLPSGRRAGAGADVAEPVGAELCGFEAPLEKVFITSLVKYSMPHSVWWITNHSFVPRSL